MLRSIKSGQRKMRVLALKVVAGVVQDTLDARQVTASSGSVVLKVPMAQVPAVIGDAVAVDEKTITFDTALTGDILIIGSDTSEKY